MRTFICWLALITAATAAAQTETAEVTGEAPAAVALLTHDEQPIEEVVVSGEYPGPGLWKISKGDNVLWILGTLQPLPKKMTWRSRSVESIIAESQEVLTNTNVEADIGFFRSMLLLPSMIGVKKNPDGATLKEVLPDDLYSRWLVLKEKYLGKDGGVEKYRPIFAAQELYSEAIEKSGLTYSDLVMPVVKKLAKRHDAEITTPEILVEIDKPRAAIKEFKKSSLDDIECFAKTLERLETDLDAMRLRANAWAVGDLAGLRALPPPDQSGACRDAILNSQIVQERGFQDVPERMTDAWLAAAEAALEKNTSTLAVVSISMLLRPDGYADRLRAKGYAIEAPAK